MHILKSWRSDTRIYAFVCGFESTDPKTKPHSLNDVTCLECLRITLKRQSDEIQMLKAMGRAIAHYNKA